MKQKNPLKNTELIKRKLKWYKIMTPSGKVYAEELDLKQAKNLKIAGFKIKKLSKKPSEKGWYGK